MHGEKTHSYKISLGELEGKIGLRVGRPRCRWKDHI